MKLFTKADAPVPAPAGMLPRVAGDAAVQHAADALAACQQQADRVTAEHAAAREQIKLLEAGALEAERRGEKVVDALADAKRRADALADMEDRCERGCTDAQAAVGRAMDDARRRLAPEFVRRITALLCEQEEAAWRIRDQQAAINYIAQLAFAEGIPIGVSPTLYWSIGFPGLPWLREDEAVLCWIRNRSIAARWTTERGK